MDYICNPSLEQRALVSIAYALWCTDEIVNLIKQFLFLDLWCQTRQQWRITVEDKVVAKVPELLIAENLKQKLLDIVKPIGPEIMKLLRKFPCAWRMSNFEKFHVCFRSSQGTLDQSKTAELLISDENVPKTDKFKLASIYCQKDAVRTLWAQMSEIEKSDFYSKDDPVDVHQVELVVFWTYKINGELYRFWDMISDRYGRTDDPFDYPFEISALSGNLPATKYFFKKLFYLDREAIVTKNACYVARRSKKFSNSEFPPTNYFPEILCFLLSQLDKTNQIKVFKNCSMDVLRCVVVWPYTKYFTETAKLLYNYLTASDFYDLLMSITSDIKTTRTDYDWQKLFVEFWLHSLPHHKKYVIFKCINDRYTSVLFHINDLPSFAIILNSATAEEKKELIFSERGMDLCTHLIAKENWNLLSFLVVQCISSRILMQQFIESMRNVNPWRCSQQKLEAAIEKFIKMTKIKEHA